MENTSVTGIGGYRYRKAQVIKIDLEKEKLRQLLLNFFVHGMESVTCDECGAKGTGKRFDQLYSTYLESLK